MFCGNFRLTLPFPFDESVKGQTAWQACKKKQEAEAEPLSKLGQ